MRLLALFAAQAFRFGLGALTLRGALAIPQLPLDSIPFALCPAALAVTRIVMSLAAKMPQDCRVRVSGGSGHKTLPMQS